MRILIGCLAFGLLTGCSDDSHDATGGHGGEHSHGGEGGTGGSGGNPSSGGSGGTGGASTKSLSVDFEAKVGAMPFSCATTFPNLGTQNSTVSFLDFRMYIHDVEIVSGAATIPVTLDQDGTWQHDNLALLDFEDKTGTCANGTTPTNTKVSGVIPGDATPTKLRFKIGVPVAMNHGDTATAPSPLNLSGMFWDWQFGYKFLRADATITGAAGPFLIHLGSTACTGDPMQNEPVTCASLNVVEVELEGFAIGKKVVLDYAKLIEANDLSQNQAEAPGCMSGVTDPECETLFAELGVNLATGLPSDTSPAWITLE